MTINVVKYIESLFVNSSYDIQPLQMEQQGFSDELDINKCFYTKNKN